MRYWLAKSEPDEYSIDDLKADKVCYWDGVRNYQARNYLREMQVGDKVLFYHSNANPPGVAGVMKVVKAACPDPSQFDKKDKHFDPKSTKENPRWFCPDFSFETKFKNFVPLDQLRQHKKLSGLELLRRGSRLSVHPVERAEYETIVALGSPKRQ